MIQFLVWGQFFLLVFSAIWMLVFIAARNRLSKRNARYELEVEEILYLLIADADQFESTLSLVSMTENWKRNSFQKVLVRIMGEVVGNELLLLKRLYVKAKFIKDDLKLCRSKLWKDRLLGLVRLSHAENDKLAPLVQNMVNDDSTTVSYAAYLVLSIIPDKQKKIVLLTQIPDRLLLKSDFLLALVKNIFDVSGAEPLVYALEYRTTPDRVRIAILAVLAQSKSIDHVDTIVKSLPKIRTIQSEFLSVILISLKDIITEKEFSRLTPLLFNQEPRIRHDLIQLAADVGYPLDLEMFSFESDKLVLNAVDYFQRKTSSRSAA